MTPTEVLFTIAELQEQVHQASTELLTAAVAVRTENLVKQPAALTDVLGVPCRRRGRSRPRATTSPRIVRCTEALQSLVEHPLLRPG